ncbi:hypothetical protein BDV41DRAFT_539212 [Aspergillus transmontanensis]|uniref:Uncharacterized protein n=1 Tax=Aspergillus transmontanensis TaxID=1034304 RepID=A0A5N6VUU5_9EURO|nr:hypothetical protein BDV41DRAFT_539212 [Aspergillus transmontanensis]
MYRSLHQDFLRSSETFSFHYFARCCSFLGYYLLCYLTAFHKLTDPRVPILGLEARYIRVLVWLAEYLA